MNRKFLIISLFSIIVISIAVFDNSFYNKEFLYDGAHLIQSNYAIRNITNIFKFFTLDFWRTDYVFAGRVYRPVVQISLTVDYFLWHLNPFGYHLTSLLIHIICVILVFWIAYLIFKNKFVALLAGLIMATHPIHVGSVTWMKARAELLTCLFFLLSWFFYIFYYRVFQPKKKYLFYSGSLLFFILSLLSKESGAILPLVLVLYSLFFVKHENFKNIIFKTAPFFILVLLYVPLINSIGEGIITKGKEITLLVHFLNVIATISYYIKLFFWPLKLNVEHPFLIRVALFDPCMKVTIFSWIKLIWILLKLNLWFLIILFIAFFSWKKYKKISFCSILVLVLLLPISNVILFFGRPIGESRAYLPSVGFCLFLSSILLIFPERRFRFISKKFLRKIIFVVSLLFILFYSFITISQNRVWFNRLALWKTAVERSPVDMATERALSSLASQYRMLGRTDMAIKYFKKAIKKNPRGKDNYIALGECYEDNDKLDKAIKEYEKAVQIDSSDEGGYIRLSIVYYEKKDFKKAKEMYEEAIDRDPYRAHFKMGEYYFSKELFDKALKEYKKGLELELPDKDAPSKASLYIKIGNCYEEKKLLEEAGFAYAQAVKLEPYDEGRYLKLGNYYKDKKDFDDAIEYYKKGLDVNRYHEWLHFNLADTYREKGNLDKAIIEYRKCLRIDPGNIASRINLAASYGLKKDYRNAVIQLKKVITLSPYDWLAYLNLGVSLKFQEKWKQAIEAFKKVISLNPKQYASLYNDLGVCYAKIKLYDKAKKNFNKALEIEPGFVNAKANLLRLKNKLYDYRD